MNDQNWRNRFVERFNYLKKTERLTQEGLAEWVGVTQGTIGHWKSGRRSPDTFDLFEKLASGLKMHPAELLYGIPPLSTDALALVSAWERLSRDNQIFILGTINGLIESQHNLKKKA